MAPNELRPAKSPYLVPFDGSFRVKDAPTKPKKELGDLEADAALAEAVQGIGSIQQRLHASNRLSVLMLFQAMDAAGKDGTIRAVLTGVNPASCQVKSFQAPTHLELDHDFMWRINQALPQRGNIGVFNRSHYEEVLTVRVHPEFLGPQRVTVPQSIDKLWEQRFRSIREAERHWARNGTIIMKFWLNVSKKEQARRLMERIERPESNWKFQAQDVTERQHWSEYMHAYEEALSATSRKWAPWYAIPADHKPTARVAVARIVLDRLSKLELAYPKLPAPQRREMGALLSGLRSGAL